MTPISQLYANVEKKLLSAFWVIVLSTLAVSAFARSASDVVLLNSTSDHGDRSRWTMAKASDVKAEPAAISQAGFPAKDWQEAIVPGTVLNSLVRNGVYPEPYFGMNNALEKNRIPDLKDTGPDFYTYWFRTEFAVPKNFQGRQVWLQLDGINYRAEIWLNGRRLGNMAGMFRRGVFNATDAIRFEGPNALAVLVKPVDEPGGFKSKAKKTLAAGENRNGGDGKIGRNTTMLMSVGWDFTFSDGIRDRNTGIWRDVKLFATGPVVLRNPFIQSRLPLPSLTPASETISVEVVNATEKPQSGVLEATIPEAGIAIHKTISLRPHETQTVALDPSEYPSLAIAKPRLWWPLNKGEPFLYHLNLKFKQGETISDRSETRFAIREITSDCNTPDKSRQFLVNGRRLFLHGSNWIPEAMCRGSDDRTEAELRYTKQSGVNFLRLWGGGIAESDRFFDLCDELGILVWMEFWQTGDTELPTDRDLYRANVADTVLRIRNHPCLAYYVSANERKATTVVPIADLLDQLDGTRGYQAASEIDGIHDGSPYVSENPMFYYEDTASVRGSRINGLCPEYGCPILPTVDCLREMMEPKDLWPINKAVWKYLDGGGFHGMTGNYDECVAQYGPSESIETYAMKAQVFGALAYRAIWECWNANKFDYGDRFSTGLLFWYHNSPNRQVCGRMWDWSLEPTAALYFSQTAHQPLHAQFDFLKNTVSVNNELPQAFENGRVTIRVFNQDMHEALAKKVEVTVPAEAFAKDLFTVEFPQDVSPVHFIKLELDDAKGRRVSENFYWRSNKEYKRGRTWTGPQFEGFEDLQKLPKVALTSQAKWQRSGDANVCTATVSNPSKNLAFFIWLRLQHANDGKPVRPAFYDDNFFSLLPGESRTIRIEYADKAAGGRAAQLRIDGWNIEPQTLSP